MRWRGHPRPWLEPSPSTPTPSKLCTSLRPRNNYLILGNDLTHQILATCQKTSSPKLYKVLPRNSLVIHHSVDDSCLFMCTTMSYRTFLLLFLLINCPYQCMSEQLLNINVFVFFEKMIWIILECNY